MDTSVVLVAHYLHVLSAYRNTISMGNPKTSQHVVIVYIYIILMIKSSYKLAIPQVERQLEFVCFSLCDGPLL